MESGHASENKTSSPANEQQQQHDGSSPLPNPDRIPPHVFARTSTTTPTEWSAASNESLFSIHAANTSFSKEQLSLMYKSGELLPGYNCDSMNISSPLLELPRTRQFTDFKSGNLDEGVGEYGVTESAPAAEATRGVFTEKERKQKDDTPVENLPHSRNVSTQSDTSVKSFAFPVFAGEGDKCGSLKKGTKNKKEQSQPSTSLEENPDISQENLKTQTQKTIKNAGFKKWFSCLSCCPSSS